jgi:uncharacterized caspase-like protein
MKNSDLALFYYSGHGIQAGGFNYIVPVDANPASEAQGEYDCIPTGWYRVMSFPGT